jgi:tRNA dimethylallyltransferase
MTASGREGGATRPAEGIPAVPTVIAIFGPTGVGKTAVAVELAELLRRRGEDPVAVSADALQIYAGLETLTGAPSAAERARLEHRLVGSVPLTETCSVGEFMPRAHAEIDAALSGRRVPIVVGGTGLYLRAALTDLDLSPPPPAGVRERLEARLERDGLATLHAELAVRAPSSAREVAPSDRTRVLRALELLETTSTQDADGEDHDAPTGGATPAASDSPPRSQLWSDDTRHPTFLVGLVMERAQLYAAIDDRVDAIAAAGAAAEVRRAEARGASRTARKALGYEQLLTGDVEGMKRRSRNYAKRQLTWMRKLAGVQVIDVTGRQASDVAREIADHVRRSPAT